MGEKACSEELPGASPSHCCSNGAECGSCVRPGRDQGLQKVQVTDLDREEDGKEGVQRVLSGDVSIRQGPGRRQRRPSSTSLDVVLCSAITPRLSDCVSWFLKGKICRLLYQLGSQWETDGTLKLGDLRRACERSIYKGVGRGWGAASTVQFPWACGGREGAVTMLSH